MLKNKTLAYILIALVISCFVYREWISFSMFAFGDWAFSFSETIREYLQTGAWGIHGGPLLWKYPLQVIFGILGGIGLDFNVVEKLTILWPIIFIIPISSFFLVKKQTGSNIAAFIGSLVFSYNTYFLSIDTQGHQLLTIAFAIAPFAILFFINLLSTKKIYYALLTALTLFAVGFYDLRSLYITSGVIVLYSIYNQLIVEKKYSSNLKVNFKKIFIVFILLGLLNLYWLLPVISMKSLTVNEYLIRQLFGGEFYSLQSAITMFYPFWTGEEPTWFNVQAIPFSFWLYPILAFAGLILTRNKKATFFGLLAIIGIFLTKQESIPFPQIYSWLYSTVPGFAAFREASKFYFLLAISYSVLIGFFAAYIQKIKDKKIRYLGLILLISFALITTKPMLTGEINTMFIKKVVPQDFVKLKDYIVNQSDYSRVWGVNLNQSYNFTTYNHPTLNALYSLRNFWGREIVSYDFEDKRFTEGEKLIVYLKSDEGKRLLSSSSIGFVPFFIQDKQTNQSIRRDLGKDKKYFEQSINKISYLKPVDIGLENILLYKNTDVKPHVYLTSQKESLASDIKYSKITYRFINESEYKVRIENLSKPSFLNLTELYHPDWRIRIGDFEWHKIFLDQDYFISKEIHFQNSSRFNEYLLDPKYIKSNVDPSRYIQNKDGSLSFDATIYYKPQSYLYLGIIISSLTLIITIIGLVYFKIRKR